MQFSSDHSSRLNPDFCLVRHDYRIRLAEAYPHLQHQANKLVASMYGSRGFTLPASICNNAPSPGLTTLTASIGHRVFGTLSLGLDNKDGLQADTLYRQEIDRLRASGARVCEATRLAIDPVTSSPHAMATLFNVLFVLAREVFEHTDLLAEVHPRHAEFYQRALGYQRLGPERLCPRVNAPAVLMRLCLQHASEQVIALAGKKIPRERSLYRHFLPLPEQRTLVQQLTQQEATAESRDQGRFIAYDSVQNAFAV